jgi:hypothetical protein
VPGNLCETILPPMTTFGEGHLIRCRLSRAILDEMEPVITQVGQKRSMERWRHPGRGRMSMACNAFLAGFDSPMAK